MFGPFHNKECQNTLKCYGVLFTCLLSCAVHIEMAKSMEADSFTLGLRCFIARTDNVRTIWYDNKSNFVCADRVGKIYGGDES